MAYLEKNDGTSILLQALPGNESGNGQLVVDGDGKRYAGISELLDAYPELTDAEHLGLCCSLFLHFHPGPGCVLIQDPEEYRTRYAALMEHGNASGEPSIADFGPFDVNAICLPERHDGQLVFYAEDALYGVPYRVETAWPPAADAHALFQLLPVLD